MHRQYHERHLGLLLQGVLSKKKSYPCILRLQILLKQVEASKIRLHPQTEYLNYSSFPNNPYLILLTSGNLTGT